MKVKIELPEDVSSILSDEWGDVEQRSLEAVVVEGYRTGALTEAQVGRALRFGSRFQVHALLKEHGVPIRYTESDLEEDLAAHRALGILPRR